MDAGLGVAIIVTMAVAGLTFQLIEDRFNPIVRLAVPLVLAGLALLIVQLIGAMEWAAGRTRPKDAPIEPFLVFAPLGLGAALGIAIWLFESTRLTGFKAAAFGLAAVAVFAVAMVVWADAA
jgi:hypothetical protein